MHQAKVAIVGGGCVGLSTALALSLKGISVVVIDAKGSSEPLSEEFGLRVSAINHASEALFRELGVWQGIAAQRMTPYTQMDVRDKDSFAHIHFASEEYDVSHLGHIIENDVIHRALVEKLERQDNVTLLFNTAYKDIHQGDNNVLITLTDGTPVMSELLIAADGANSGVRQRFNLPITFKDYGHHALVATVKTAQPHDNCARQVFLSDGPLAFLPLADPHYHSIVWSCSPQQAATYQNMSEQEFNKALFAAFDGQCGLCTVQSARAVFPLTMRYARQWVKERIVLVGDAAHTIHPLAGLGMNLGLQDAARLSALISDALTDSMAATARALRTYERERKLDAQKHIATMAALKGLFAGDNPVKKIVRGLGLSAVNEIAPLKQAFAEQALGQRR
ncbi:FAD-dependent oxidoreductase [Pseudoalteromonas ruthenica]|uniref:FAD-dependent oxidoreductase n=1 Tax=Pseudoalteromonas ruthenica TaxID=151081 RepID=UPI00110B27E8|nr:FAD-dependent oxidoreductase [Pseudoalteromonas ruthenica]TMO43265.1 monooxygenase [Pseudoalteromonas ruthenica]TMO52506.1 monooxygenase [Pseudoalteromonas ruthenica]